MTNTLYPHEILMNWIENHILWFWLLLSIIVIVILSNVVFDFIFRNQFEMYSYGSCDIGIK